MSTEKKEELVLTGQEQESLFLTKMIASKQLPVHIKTVEQAFTVAQMGRELGLAPMMSFHYIIPIQGKLTLSAKATGAVLRKGGVQFVTLEDGVFVYRNGDTSKVGGNRGTAEKPDKPVDRRTTIKFTRGEQIETVDFTWSDATAQGLTDKDNWKRLPKITWVV